MFEILITEFPQPDFCETAERRIGTVKGFVSSLAEVFVAVTPEYDAPPRGDHRNANTTSPRIGRHGV